MLDVSDINREYGSRCLPAIFNRKGWLYLLSLTLFFLVLSTVAGLKLYKTEVGVDISNLDIELLVQSTTDQRCVYELIDRDKIRYSIFRSDAREIRLEIPSASRLESVEAAIAFPIPMEIDYEQSGALLTGEWSGRCDEYDLESARLVKLLEIDIL